MIKNKSKLIKIFFLGITIIINTKICLAFTIVSSGGSGDSGNSMSTGEGTIRSENKQIEYEYKYSVGSSKGVSVNAYNMNGESVIPNNPIVDESKHKFKAGTWIGIHATETQSSSWKLAVQSFKFEEVKKKYVCLYRKKITPTYEVIPYEDNRCPAGCTFSVSSGKCSCKSTWYYYEYEEEEITTEFFDPKAGTCEEKTGWEKLGLKSNKIDELRIPYDGDEITKIKNDVKTQLQAAARAILSSSTGQIRYIKQNSYPLEQKICKNSPDTCYGTIVGKSEKGIQQGPSGDSYGSYYIDFEYLQENICINAKTSDVTYGRECNENEIKIKNAEVYDEHLNSKIKYWHYFIPLNAKSTDDFWVEAVTNESNYFNIDECVSVIKELSKNNQTYKGYILPLVGDDTFFEGDYLSYNNPERSKDYKLLQSGGGCKLSAKVRIPVTQEFYNETTNKEGIKRFKGFNFYYKPININNPFPNRLSATSLWKEWYDTVKSGQIATPDISKSFNEVTYIATNINAAKVRNYTKNNPYTSWKNISLGGRSSFIENENIVTRNEGVSFYKLGCGPYNSDWSECKK